LGTVEMDNFVTATGGTIIFFVHAYFNGTF
jgi:hypothetical protein